MRLHALAAAAVVFCGLTATAVHAAVRAATRSPSPVAAARAPAAAVLVPARAALAAPVADQPPLALWPLNDGPGVVHDATGRHPGTVRGNVGHWRIGQGPGVYSDSFDGATGRITVAAAGLSGDAVAASAWFRTPARSAGPLGSVLDTGGIAIRIADAHLVVTTCATSLPCRSVVAPPTVTDAAWHQVVVSVAGPSVTVFVDGAPAGHGLTYGVTAAPANGLIGIGRHFVGNIDNVALYSAPLSAKAIQSQFVAGACPQAGAAPAAVPSSTLARTPALPLRTRGRYVVDAHGRRVKLAGVNWYGAEALDRVPAGLQCRSADAIAARIASLGFNVVRIPWSTDTWTGADPRVPTIAVAANPTLWGAGAREVFDAVIDALSRHGLLVVLDNHVTRPDWCCSTTDGNALWWTGYDETQPPRWQHWSRRAKSAYFSRGNARWLAAWRAIAGRYGPWGSHPVSAVVGADLRNEPRADALLGVIPAWARAGTLPRWADWPRAAMAAGNAVLRRNPRLLVIVEGTDYATDLRGVGVRPVHLVRAHRLVYSVHDYSFTQPAVTSGGLGGWLDGRWGWLRKPGRWYTTPVWVGEFGTCHPGEAGCGAREAAWFTAFTRYLRARDDDWAYWSINGTGARGAAEPQTCAETMRFPGCDEGYGLSDASWADDSSRALVRMLRRLEPASQR